MNGDERRAHGRSPWTLRIALLISIAAFVAALAVIPMIFAGTIGTDSDRGLAVAGAVAGFVSIVLVLAVMDGSRVAWLLLLVVAAAAVVASLASPSPLVGVAAVYFALLLAPWTQRHLNPPRAARRGS